MLRSTVLDTGSSQREGSRLFLAGVLRLPPLLGRPAAALGLQPAFLGRRRRPGRPPRLGLLGGPLDQLDESLDHLAAVRVLSPPAAAEDRQEPIIAHAF